MYLCDHEYLSCHSQYFFCWRNLVEFNQLCSFRSFLKFLQRVTGNVQMRPGKPWCHSEQGTCSHIVCWLMISGTWHWAFYPFCPKSMLLLWHLGNRKLQFRQPLTRDVWPGRKTVAFYSSFMAWFSLALTVLKFSERPFANIAQGWSISTLIALHGINLK